MNNTISTQEELIRKIQELRNAQKQTGVDLSTTEDLSIAVMNLISLEEHFFFTGVKTYKDQYFDSALEIRNLRKELLQQLMPEHEGETWCASKHLLAATMRLIEVGNKLQSEGKKDLASHTFGKAYRVYTLFWGLKLRLVNVQRIPAKSGAEENTNGALDELVKQLADCCKE